VDSDNNSITRTGLFRDIVQEDLYRRQYLNDDRFLVKCCAGPGVFGALYFVINDHKLFSLTEPFYILLAIRFLCVAISIGVWVRVRGPITPSQLDRWMLIWCFVSVITNLYVNSTRPNSYMGYATISRGCRWCWTACVHGSATRRRTRRVAAS